MPWLTSSISSSSRNEYLHNKVMFFTFGHYLGNVSKICVFNECRFKFVLDLVTMVSYMHLKPKIQYLSFKTGIIIWKKFKLCYICIILYVYMCTCVWVPICHVTDMGLRGQLWESVISFNHVDSEDWTRFVRLGNKHLYLLSLWSSLRIVFKVL